MWLTAASPSTQAAEGKVYICVAKDVWSRRIVGWATSDRMTLRLADAALCTQVTRRRPTRTGIVHSGRGGQFRSRRYQRTLKAHWLFGSMGRLASAGDNAAMNSFFALLQNNVLDRQSWKSRGDFTDAIISTTETTYRHCRRQRSLSRMTALKPVN